jgi:protein-S-isoprenylcysteine O-methyltransferase Ste14
MAWNMVARSVGFWIFLALLLFLPAGTANWPGAWAYVVLFTGASLGLGLWLEAFDPELLAERMRPPLSRDQKPRDRAIMAAISLTFLVWLPFMALDAKRFGWSHIPVWAQALGAVMLVLPFFGWVWVLRTNRFASTNIRVQKERGQTVISTGPYAIVRHPMYGFAIPFLAGTPLLLGSLYGLLGLLVILPLLALRTLGEEALLREDLPGYREYAQKVRYRFVPGVW